MTFVTVTTGDNSPLPLPDHMSLRQAHQHVKESDTKHNCCSIKGLQLDNHPTLLGQILWAPAGVSFLFHIRKAKLMRLVVGETSPQTEVVKLDSYWNILCLFLFVCWFVFVLFLFIVLFLL